MRLRLDWNRINVQTWLEWQCRRRPDNAPVSWDLLTDIFRRAIADEKRRQKRRTKQEREATK